MRISCSILQPVSVTDYKRFRLGSWEFVHTAGPYRPAERIDRKPVLVA